MNRIAKTIAAAALGLGALVASSSMGSTAHAATAPAGGWDAAFCARYVPADGFDPGQFIPGEDRWERLGAHFWADRELHRDVFILAFAIDHGEWNVVRLKQFDVWMDCQGE